MCRVRFRKDGIYLSLPYIGLLEEPSFPLEGTHGQPLSSTVPLSLSNQRLIGKGLTRYSEVTTQNRDCGIPKAVEDITSAPSLSLLSLPSSDTDDGNSTSPITSFSSSRHDGVNEDIDTKPSTARSLPPPISPAFSPFKQVRFSNLVEERTITSTSNEEYDGSDVASDSSESSHSSRDSDVDEEAHMLLQENAIPEADFHEEGDAKQAGLPSDGIVEPFQHRPNGKPSKGTGVESENRSSPTYIEAIQRAQGASRPETTGDDKAVPILDEDDWPSPNYCSEESFDSEDFRKSRFQTQKMLSPLSRNSRSGAVAIEEAAGACPDAKHGLRRSTEIGETLRTRFNGNENVRKTATAEEKRNYEPHNDDAPAQSTDEQDNLESGMTR